MESIRRVEKKKIKEKVAFALSRGRLFGLRLKAEGEVGYASADIGSSSEGTSWNSAGDLQDAAPVLTSKETFTQALSATIDSLGASRGELRSAGLSLPDASAKIAVMDFDELPSDVDEALEIVRWKMAKDSFIDPLECVVDYQLLGHGGSVGGEAVRVLAVAVDKGLLTSYEDSAYGLGVTFTSITMHALNVMNLLRTLKSPEGDFAVTLNAGDYLTVAFFKDASLDFIRTKECASESFLTDVSQTFTFYAGKKSKCKKVYAIGASFEVRDMEEATGVEVELLGLTELIPEGLKADALPFDELSDEDSFALLSLLSTFEPSNDNDVELQKTIGEVVSG